MSQPFPDLPTAAPQITDTLAKTHQTVVFTPNGDASLAYRIVLPNGWMAESNLGPQISDFAQPQLIGLFAPKPDPAAPFVSVSVTRLPIEVDLEDWIDFVCGRDGWEVFSSRWLKTPRGLVADAGALKKKVPPRDVMRVMARADSGRIFLTSGVASETQWGQWKDQLLVASASFELVTPTGDDSLEPLLQFEGGDPAFGVAFPASWQLEEQPPTKPGKSAVNIRLAQEGQLLAYILVKATDLQVHPEAKVETLFNQAQRELVQSGFQPSSKGVFPAVDPLGKQVPGYQGTAVVPGRMWDQNVEARLGFRLLPGLAISVTLISVTQQENPLLWMRSKRAFELVRQLNWKVEKPAA